MCYISFMPKPNQFTREDVVNTAFEIVRTRGIAALSARSVARDLGASTSPIFSNFRSMKEMIPELVSMAVALLRQYQSEPRSGQPFLDMGLGYVEFARREPRLFHELIGRGREISGSGVSDLETVALPMMKRDPRLIGLPDEVLYEILLKMWIFAHGVACMAKVDAEKLGDEGARRLIEDVGSAVISETIRKYRAKCAS